MKQKRPEEIGPMDVFNLGNPLKNGLVFYTYTILEDFNHRKGDCLVSGFGGILFY